MPGGRIDIEVVPDTREFPSRLGAGLRAATGIASSIGKGLGLAVAAGTAAAAVGLKQVITLGNEYQGNLNTLQAVTSATGFEMARVGQVAKDLGSDLTLPATSAADAAAAMVELAKGGLTVDEAMQAAKGTLQLAAAAQVDGAQAAEIQATALNQFGLAASDASHVADVLANTANAASGEITDVALALKYVGPVAKSVGVSIDDTAAAIGVLAKNGILADTAGTSLRGMIAGLAAPSKPAAAALADLGIQAFDSSGKFLGFRTVIDQLNAAQGRMTEEQFAAAAATAFGREPLAAIIALAEGGAPAFDEMAQAVSRQGGAAEVAAAKTRGLGGAIDGFKSQVETAGIEIYEAIDGPLEAVVRSAAQTLDRLGPAVARGLNTAVAAGQVYGPRLAEAIRSRGAVVVDAARDVLRPLATAAVGPLNTAVNVGIGLFNDLTGVLGNVVNAARPVARGISDVVRSMSEADGPVSAVATGVGLLGDAARVASVLLIPLGAAAGLIASAFAALPGPVQSAIVALGLFAAFRNPLTSFAGEVQNRLGSAFDTVRDRASLAATGVGVAFLDLQQAYNRGADGARNFIAEQHSLTAASGAVTGTLRGAAPAFERIAAVAGGAASAVGTTLRGAFSGLSSFLGGPWGVAVAGAGLLLAGIASAQADSAATARRHTSSIQSLTGALQESNGVLNDNISALRAKDLQENYTEVTRSAERFGISLSELTSASLRQGDSYDTLRTKLQAIIAANTEYQTMTGGAAAGQQIERLNDTGIAASRLLGELNNLAGGTDEAQRKARELSEAIADGRASLIDGTDAGRSFGAAMAVLADETASADDKARALKEALDALSGGQVDLEASQARLNEQLARLRDAFGENADRTQGWGAALLNTDGSINTTTENGRRLFEGLQDISASTAEVAQKTFEMSQAAGDDLPVSLGKATAAVQATRDQFIAQATQMGLNAEQAAALADRYGLVPDDVTTLIEQPGMDTAQQELLLLQAKIKDTPGEKKIQVDTLSDEAVRRLEAVGIKVRDVDGKKEIYIDALDGNFNAAVARAVAPATKTITLSYYDPGTGAGAPKPGQIKPLASGDLLTATAYAAGGVHKLTPMKAGVATVVRPNTWRIVGDRMRDDEFYIPDNNAPRSLALMRELVRRRGYGLVRMFAEGGVNGGVSGPPAVTPAPVAGPQITNTYVVRDNQTAYEVGQISTAQQAWQLRTL